MALVIPYVHQTWTDNVSQATAARMNVIEDGVFNVSYAPAVRVFHNANQTITTGTLTALAFNSERFDQAGNAADTMHDTVTNNSRLTCRYAGVYEIKGNVVWDTTATGVREIRLRLNGATYIAYIQQTATAGGNPGQSVSCLYALAVNDFVELVVQHTQGANAVVNSTANYSPEFSMVRVG